MNTRTSQKPESRKHKTRLDYRRLVGFEQVRGDRGSYDTVARLLNKSPTEET